MPEAIWQQLNSWTRSFLSYIRHFWIETLFLVLILLLGGFLRVYHFSDWLHFEIDQSYDARIISPAVTEGVDHLPLLGPTAGGGRSLRLGPAFYYLEYLSAKVFGDTPVGYAMLILILSLASLPLFYAFVRRAFGRPLSLGLLFLFASSLYMVLYSRFAWSPNVLPFFTLLSFYALLRSVSKKEQHAGAWFLISIATLTLTSQIHFNAFFTLPPIVFFFLLLKRPRFSWRVWLGGVGILLLCYSPVIISDISLHGQNFHYFMQKFSLGANRQVNLPQKISQAVVYNGSEYFLVLSGLDRVNGKRLTGDGFDSPTSNPWRQGAIALFAVELFVFIIILFRTASSAKKDLAMLVALWWVFSALYFFSIAKNGYNIYPRFYLAVAPVPFLFLGFTLDAISSWHRRIGYGAIFTACAVLGITNLNGVFFSFEQLRVATLAPIITETEDVLPNTARITLEGQNALVDYIVSKTTHDAYPVYLRAKHEYMPIFWYHLEKRGIHYHEDIRNDVLYREAHYFFIATPDVNVNDRLSRFNILEKKDFGTLIVYSAAGKPDAITADRQDMSVFQPMVQTRQISALYTWKKLFAQQAPKNDSDVQSQDTGDLQDTSNEENPSGDQGVDGY